FLLPSSTSSQSALDVNAIFDSMENRLEEVTDVEKAKSNHWVVSDQEIESWPDVVAKWKENCQILRSQVLGNIPRDLFSENPETRKGQYSVFLNKTYDSLRILSSRNEDYDFYDQNVPYLLNNCFTAWESAIDTLHQRADLEIKGSVFSKAHQVARNLREHILIIHILPSAIRNFDPEVSQEIIDNVHYKRLAKQWGNQRLRLGFSDEQLGEKESMFDMISSHLDFVTPDIMKKYYTTAAISDELNQLYDKQSEMNKNLIWDLILDSYKK
ncbi:MAG: hypothetical protein JSS09_03655, partial [Verrucomicrobia bacterium]|nr:hypothetical protein [Verrucomicrobiota bacterium]